MTKNRDEIDNKFKWDLTKIYKNDKEFIKDHKVVEDLIRNFSYEANKIIKDAKYLYDIYSTIVDLRRKIENLYVYASLTYYQDVSNTNSIKNLDLINNLYNEYSLKVSSFDSNLLKIDYKDIEEMYKKENRLLEFKRNFEVKFRYKKHILSEIEEELIAKLQKTFERNNKVFSNLTDSDIDFGFIKDENGKKVALTNTNYSLYIKSTNRKVRESAFKTLYNTYKRYKLTLTNLLDGKVNALSTMNKIRGFNSSLEASLYDDELDIEVYNALINSVNKGLKPLYKYYKLRKEILGLKDMHIYDTYVSILDDFDKKYSFDEAKVIVRNSLSPLGEDYLKIYDNSFEEKWIDVYPNVGKRGGAFSAGGYDTYPYISLNFQGDFNDVSTLSHELGHSIHSYLTRKNNSYIYGDYSIVVAEVASTVNEILLSRYIIDNSKDIKEKLYVLDRLINLYKSTIYRQTMYAEFEKYIYEKRDNNEVLTSDELEEYFYKLNKKYYGSHVIIDEEIKYEWERMPHLYYNFYVYKYATGLSSASFIANKILNNEKDYLDKYYKFLSVGSTLSPNESLSIVGIDLTKEEVCNNAIKIFEELVLEYEELYKIYRKSSD